MLTSVLLLIQTVAAPHDALRYDITLVPADTGTHLLGEAETAWRLGSADPVLVRLDSSMRVVRVLVDGKPNTRLSRTMYGRSEDDVLVPHQKVAGDSIGTRIRYHGLARGGAKLGANGGGHRVFVATGAGGDASSWLPVPLESRFDRAAASFRIQAPLAQRAVAPGALEQVDTLPYGHAVWRYRMTDPAPIASLAAAAGPYLVRTLTPGRCGDGCPVVEVWSYGGGPPDAGSSATWWEMVEFFAERAGRFPYARLVHAEAQVTAAVAAPGLVLHPEGSLAAGGAKDSTVALGTARQWFGNAISPATDDDRWIIGGLARFFADLWRDRSERRPRVWPVDTITGEHRGAGALRALRGQLGDSAFFAGIRRFVGERLHQPATRDDFARAMSAAAGRPVDLPPGPARGGR